MIPNLPIPELPTRTAIAEPLVIGLLSLIVLVLLWNKGDSTIINAKAQDEPLVGALAAVLVFVGGLAIYNIQPWRWIAGVPATLLIAFGVFLFVLAAVAIYSRRVDINLFG